MKKFLLGTTGLVAMIALPVGAQAADKIKLGLGGYYRAVFAVGDLDYSDGIREHGIGRESEVYFSGKTTLDNGIKVGAMIQLEGETSGDQIDNSYIWTSGGFGRVEVGSTWGPSLLMSAGSVGDMLDGHGDFASQNHHVNLNGVTVNTYGGDAGISQNPDDKITYFTPRLSGFQVGISYMPENHPTTDESGTALSNDESGGTGNELFDIAVGYKNTFNNIGVNAYGSYFTSSTENPSIPAQYETLQWLVDEGYIAEGDAKGVSAGFDLSGSGFKVGGRYTIVENYLGIDGGDKTAWRFGMSYGLGPWTVGAAYIVTEIDGSWSNDLGSYSGEAETKVISVGASYIAGPGIKLFGGIHMYDQSSSDTLTVEGGSVSTNSSADDTIAMIGTKLSF